MGVLSFTIPFAHIFREVQTEEPDVRAHQGCSNQGDSIPSSQSRIFFFFSKNHPKKSLSFPDLNILNFSRSYCLPERCFIWGEGEGGKEFGGTFNISGCTKDICLVFVCAWVGIYRACFISPLRCRTTIYGKVVMKCSCARIQ